MVVRVLVDMFIDMDVWCGGMFGCCLFIGGVLNQVSDLVSVVILLRISKVGDCIDCLVVCWVSWFSVLVIMCWCGCELFFIRVNGVDVVWLCVISCCLNVLSCDMFMYIVSVCCLCVSVGQFSVLCEVLQCVVSRCIDCVWLWWVSGMLVYVVQVIVVVILGIILQGMLCVCRNFSFLLL